MCSHSGGSLSALLLDIFRAGNVEGMVVEVAAGGEPVLFLNDGQLVTDLSVEDSANSFPGFQHSDVTLFLGKVGDGLDGGVENGVISEEAHSGFESITQIKSLVYI